MDRVEELQPDTSTVVLGFKWQLPRTNLRNVSVSPSNFNENYPFSVGRHRITWTGIGDKGTQKSCSFNVIVNGEEDDWKYLLPVSFGIDWNKISLCKEFRPDSEILYDNFYHRYDTWFETPLEALKSFGGRATSLLYYYLWLRHLFLRLDVTPPSVKNCPSSITERTNSLQKNITWTPPTFTDNVGVVSVLSNRQPGFTMDTYTSLTVKYTASDAAGNVGYCTFNITLEGTPVTPAYCQSYQIPTCSTLKHTCITCRWRVYLKIWLAFGIVF